MILEIITEVYLRIISPLLTIYTWIVIIGALLTWVRPDPYNPIVQFIHALTEPAYRFVRKKIPTMINNIDLTPLIIVFGINSIDIFIEILLKALVAA